MITWGWSGLSHDASLAVFVNNELKFASHAERYSPIKNYKNINQWLLSDAILEFGVPNKVYFYEKPLLKKTRQLFAGQYHLLKKESPTQHMRKFYKEAPRSISTGHHLSHASAGYYTSPYTDAAVLCIDSIGEWETLSIWKGEGPTLKKVRSQRYPDSVGMWYSAMTQRIGLIPQEHEYVLMGMAAIGDPDRLYQRIIDDFIAKMPSADDPYVMFS